MAFSFVATAGNTTAAGTSITVTKPTGTVDDDIMFAYVWYQHSIGTGYANSIPSGWTRLGQQNYNTFSYFELYYKVASSEGADYTRGFPNSGKIRIDIGTYRDGFDTADPIDVVSNTLYNLNNTTLRAASMTVSSANSPLLFIGGRSSGGASTFTPPTNPDTFTEDVDTGDTDSDRWIEFANLVWSGSGATGNIDATMSSSTGTKHAFAVALNPDSVGGNTSDFFQMF